MDGERIKKKYLSVKTTFPITMVGAWFCRYVTQEKTFLQLFSHQPKHIYTVLKLVQNQILALHIIFDREPKFKSSYVPANKLRKARFSHNLEQLTSTSKTSHPGEGSNAFQSISAT